MRPNMSLMMPLVLLFLPASTKNDKFHSPPELSERFHAVVAVSDLNQNYSFSFSEIVDNEVATLRVDEEEVLCEYNRFTGYGRRIRGISCEESTNLPMGCSNKAFVPVADIFYAVGSSDRNFTSFRVGEEMTFQRWRAQVQGFEVDALFAKSWRGLQPFSIKLLGANNETLEYSFVSFMGEDQSTSLAMMAHGVFCVKPMPYAWRPTPKLPDRFAVAVETVEDNDGAHNSIEHQLWDLDHKLVVSSTRVPSVAGVGQDPVDVVLDFNAGLQFVINRNSGNCSVHPLSVSSVRMKHVGELLDFAAREVQFVYSGKRYVRGVLCDVWIAEKSMTPMYQTTEIFFSEKQAVPMGIDTYTAPNKRSSSQFSRVSMSNFFNFDTSSFAWDENAFDISSCLQDHKRLHLRFTVDVNLINLSEVSLRQAHESLRKEISSMCQISPLRIADIQLSHSKDKTNMDVWFVLLDNPFLTFSTQEARVVWIKNNSWHMVPMSAAYRELARVISRKEVAMRLKIKEDEIMVAHILRHSLHVSSEAVRSKRVSSLRRRNATFYTAGAMAGLGFSMAILGLSVGVFVGFLLWKRRIGSSAHPYYVGADGSAG